MSRPAQFVCKIFGAALVMVVALAPATTYGQDNRRRQRPERPDRPSSSPAVRITPFLSDAGRLDWSKQNNQIVFDRVGKGRVFDIYVISPDGGRETCLTCGATTGGKSRGNPAWHPSGEYIVFQSQDEDAGLPGPLRRVSDWFANPGSGINNNIWVMDRAGRRYWQLTHVEAGVGGVLHPVFSPDGNKLLWAERIGKGKGPWGEWALKLADVRIDRGEVSIANVRTMQPGQQQRMYESHGFSPDGQQILFSGNLERGQAEGGADIYLMDIRSGQVKNLTRTSKVWDEHAHFSPDGRSILWMTSTDLPDPAGAKKMKCDYWLMDPDGGNKRRITYFNEKGHAEYDPKGVMAADAAWSPDGTRIAAYLLMGLLQGGPIVMINLR